ncbi:glycosyltransferase [Dankookia sp. GCM10030260]|uniref:glycosyltransferase n=1 Tax=Dankookia sp. GCM10030260 TaxID=3273390 RepID=UPI0036131266
MDLMEPPVVQSRTAAARAGGGLDIRHVVVTDRVGHPTEANGVHNVARALVREQRAAGDAASLILLANREVSVGEDATCPTRVIPLTGPRLRGRAVRLGGAALAALLADAGTQTVLHIHGGREPLLVGLGRALRARGVPYAITVHGRFSHVFDPAGRLLKPRTAIYLALFERGLLEGARFVQALASEERRILSRIAPRARIEVVGNGAYASRLIPGPWHTTARPPSAHFPHFVFCGRYELAHKGLDLLLEGFAAYRHSGGTGRLTTIGTGPVREQLVQMASRLGIAGSVRIEGPRFGAEREAIMAECDFCVMASRFEGVPLAALEAALLGLPLVVTAGTSLRAMVEAKRAGLPILDHTSAAVCAALHAAERLPPAEWQSRAAAAHAWARAAADWTAIAAHLRQLYVP